jgi:hypothetical protein
LLLPACILAKTGLSALTEVNFCGVPGWEFDDEGGRIEVGGLTQVNMTSQRSVKLILIIDAAEECP